MIVNGRDIGEALDAMREEIEARLRSEAGRELAVEGFEGDAFTDVRWRVNVRSWAFSLTFYPPHNPNCNAHSVTIQQPSLAAI